MSSHWKPPSFGGPGLRSGRWNGSRGQARHGWRVTLREIRLMVLGGLMLGLVAFQATQPEQSSFGSPDVRSPRLVQAVQVIDGDTFDYGGMRVRIADIDTPEVDGRCAYERDLAAQATDRMAELLDEGPFELHPVGGRDQDRYGRKLRIVTRDGESLGDVLVSEGLARTWTGQREPWC